MKVIHERCAGLDVHKRKLTACRVLTQPDGQVHQETVTFGTTTAELLRLLEWLQKWDCTHVAMESTGVYWKPVYNILEGHMKLLLVNAQHIKRVPGRKTDVKDAEWLADLLRHGLVRGSFVPPQEQRELRDLTRQRETLVRERASVVNRLHKVLEDANIKLASVATDLTGVSARAMLEQIIAGSSDPAALAELARGRMGLKITELEQALDGRVRDHHRFLLVSHLTHIDFLDEQIAQFDQRVAAHIDQMPPLTPDPAPGGETDHPESDAPGEPPLTYREGLELADSIPGLGRRLVENILAETGINMGQFPSADHLASWSGSAPGNDESAGKRRSGKTPPGNRHLRKYLVQAATGASRTKDTYLAAQYHRLVPRRGKKRAKVAVGHSIIVILYHVLDRREPYRDLGGNYFDERKREAVVNRLVRRLDDLGYEVALEPKSGAVPAAA